MIEVLYPEVCCLFGDKANARYLGLCLGEDRLATTHVTQTPRFASEDPHMVYLCSMSERSQERVIERLRPHRERLRTMIDDGVVFLLTGNAFEVFAASIEDDQGRTIEGLGLLDIQVKRHLPTRFNSLFLGQHAQTKIVGYTSRFTHSYGYDQTQGLFSVTQGLGMNPEVNYEGIQVNNLFATYLLGPLLIQNPLFTRYLLGVIDRDAPLSELPYEAELMQAYETRVQEFESGIDFVD